MKGKTVTSVRQVYRSGRRVLEMKHDRLLIFFSLWNTITVSVTRRSRVWFHRDPAMPVLMEPGRRSGSFRLTLTPWLYPRRPWGVFTLYNEAHETQFWDSFLVLVVQIRSRTKRSHVTPLTCARFKTSVYSLHDDVFNAEDSCYRL